MAAPDRIHLNERNIKYDNLLGGAWSDYGGQRTAAWMINALFWFLELWKGLPEDRQGQMITGKSYRNRHDLPALISPGTERLWRPSAPYLHLLVMISQLNTHMIPVLSKMRWQQSRTGSWRSRGLASQSSGCLQKVRTTARWTLCSCTPSPPAASTAVIPSSSSLTGGR